MRIAQERPDQPEVMAMLEASDAYAASLYPAESNHMLDLGALLNPSVRFLVARDAEGRPLGCGAVVEQQGAYGEIKRMWVDPACRGQGTGKALLAGIEAEARACALPRLRLETGIHQPEAIALYEQAGFTRIPPFGAYRPDPLSLFMEKCLD